MSTYRENNRHYQVYYRRESRSVFAAILRFIIFTAVIIAALAAGLWLVGAAVGLVVGLFVLAIGLAPLFFVVWLVWVVMKAIFS